MKYSLAFLMALAAGTCLADDVTQNNILSGTLLKQAFSDPQVSILKKVDGQLLFGTNDAGTPVAANTAFVSGSMNLPLDVTSFGNDEDDKTTQTRIVTSPDGHTRIDFTLHNGTPYYRVVRDDKEVVGRSALGFSQLTTFANGISKTETKEIRETYTIPHGKRSTYENICNELTVSLDGTGTQDLDITFRVYNDAIAFKYSIQQNDGLSKLAINDEQTEFNFPTMSSARAMNYDYGYSGSNYNSHQWADLTNEDGYNEPMLVTLGGTLFGLITEAYQTGSIAASRLVKGDVQNQIKMRLDSESKVTYPFETPWRTIILGSLKDIVESSVTTSLCPPSVLADDSWVEPGLVSWNWGGEDMDGTATTEVYKAYVDFASYMGWKYCLMDEGWKGKMNVPQFVEYCHQKNVEPMLWFNQKDFANDYNAIYEQMKPYANEGVKALKIDFFDSDAQDKMAKYINILKAAADLKLCIDFHGCTRPTGLERTYPNLLTMEAVWGGEMNLDWHHMIPADYQANLVFTRNVIGPMDFTPGKIATKKGKIFYNNTWGNAMAQMVLFESGAQCVPDKAENIEYSVAEPLYKTVPAAWDDIRFINGRPDAFAAVARRKGGNWFVGGVSKDSRSISIPLDFLSPDSTYYAYIYKDATLCRYNVDFLFRDGLKSTDKLSVRLSSNGGAVVIFSTSDKLPRPEGTTYEAETYARYGGKSTVDNNCSGRRRLANIGNDTRAEIRNVNAPVEGDYALTMYYKLYADRDKAYIQVGDDGTKSYYTLEKLEDNDNAHGTIYAMKTVFVHLQAGDNVIHYGNEDGMAPDLDKIIVTPTQEVLTGISTPTFGKTDGDTNGISLRVNGNNVTCTTLSGGRLDVFSLGGQRLFTKDIPAGESTTQLDDIKGTVIVSLSTGARGYSKKVVLK